MEDNRDLGAFETKLIAYLKKYFVIGGMPAAVAKWVETNDYYDVEDVQRKLVISYQNDFSKHAPRQIVEKIRHVWDSIAYDSNAIFSRSFFDDSPTPYPTIHGRGKKITGERETTNPKFTANLQ